MRKTTKRCVAFLLAMVMLFAMAACGSKETKKEVDGPALVQALLNQVTFASPLSDVGDSAFLYFSNLPEGTQVKLYTGSGYYADEVALLTLAKTSDAAAAKTSVESHIAQIRSQFASYIPEELGKIDKAVVWEGGNYIIVCITDDHANAKKLLDSGDPNYQISGKPNPNTTTGVPGTTGLPGTTGTLTPPATGTVPPITNVPTPPGGNVDTSGYPIIMSQSGTWQSYTGGIIRVDNAGFEICGYSDPMAATYAALVNKVADNLAGTTKVYCLPIPTAYSITMPNDIQTQQSYYENPVLSIQKLDGHLNANVTTVNCADNLLRHRNEYIYFRTDHHWNGKGAYYAYEAFCQTKGIQPYTLEQRQKMTFDGFLGSYYTHSNSDNAFLPADTVEAYKPYSSNASMVYYDRNGAAHNWSIIADVSSWAANNKYNTFAGGDNPLTVFTNPQVTDGSVCVVVKESFGNALLPYLVDHYSTIYEVDYRYWTGDLATYAREVGADDLIFANNLGMIATNVMVAKLANVIH